MKRKWVVRPDETVASIDGSPVPAVSLDAFLRELNQAGIIIHKLGGVLEIVCSRVPTGVEGERVSAAYLISYKDRTDAREAAETIGHELRADEPPAAPAPAAEPPVENGAVPVGVSASGEEVDESDVPPELRGL